MKYLTFILLIVMIGCKDQPKQTTNKAEETTSDTYEITQGTSGYFTDNVKFKIEIKYNIQLENSNDKNPYSNQVNELLEQMYDIGYNTSSEDYRVFRHNIKPINKSLADIEGIAITSLVITSDYEEQ